MCSELDNIEKKQGLKLSEEFKREFKDSIINKPPGVGFKGFTDFFKLQKIRKAKNLSNEIIEGLKGNRLEARAVTAVRKVPREVLCFLCCLPAEKMGGTTPPPSL